MFRVKTAAPARKDRKFIEAKERRVRPCRSKGSPLHGVQDGGGAEAERRMRRAPELRFQGFAPGAKWKCADSSLYVRRGR